jgi:hypothetical protein
MDTYHSYKQAINDYHASLIAASNANISSASAAALASTKDHKLAVRTSIPQESVQASTSNFTASIISITIEHVVTVVTRGNPHSGIVIGGIVYHPSQLRKTLVARAPTVGAPQAAASTTAAALTSTKADQPPVSTPAQQESDIEGRLAVCTSTFPTTTAYNVIEKRGRGWDHTHSYNIFNLLFDPKTTKERFTQEIPPATPPTPYHPESRWTTKTKNALTTARPELLSSINSIYRQWGLPTRSGYTYLAAVETKTVQVYWLEDSEIDMYTKTMWSLSGLTTRSLT